MKMRKLSLLGFVTKYHLQLTFMEKLRIMVRKEQQTMSHGESSEVTNSPSKIRGGQGALIAQHGMEVQRLSEMANRAIPHLPQIIVRVRVKKCKYNCSSLFIS